MSRVSMFSAPFLLGFDAFEERVDRLAKAADGYPPYNIERTLDEEGAETFLISIAVAGFARADLEVMTEDNQLLVRGRQKDDPAREYLHRGIAARQFARSFVLADGMEVTGARLENGLLELHLERPEPRRMVRRIQIGG